ncbi:hypothetical protein C6376_10460 [Streptomyces sp. P3]|uniref:CHAT domain-containing protein n=1 Tax=Streptomyces sp. P3 TaxID=2135430 RepID=UPI000D19C741|nr:CHAT domain-containing protein [Streptomyces sp. P3]AVV41801.1 hypothetical protein C6376_10460 [Streptomyces sp. P3]
MLLVEYAAFDDGLLVFGVRKDWDRPEMVALTVDEAELTLFIDANFSSHHTVRAMFDYGMEDQWHAYDFLIQPLSRWAQPDDIICLIPHGRLHYLPLHALRIDGAYLIERNPVVYSPSASVLHHCRSRRRPSGPARSGWGAAVFADSRCNLPQARVEAARIGELLGSEPLLGDRVTRENLIREVTGADIIHIAGHAEFHRANALESGIQLAGTDVMTAADVFGLDAIDTDLVTLSACETGVSENHPGDELIGLTRAFLYARASSVLVSLWAVADESTAFLMERFYTHLLGRPDGLKADALRQAILDTKDRAGWESFFYWAPFVLIGDWR